MSESQRAFIALGANMDDPAGQLTAALQMLAMIPGIRMLHCSRFYASAPVGYADQPDFVNAVAEISTTLSPKQLLEALLAVEAARGRTRSFRNAPRTLDLDVLLYGDAIINEPGLNVPHPRMHERAFVLVPLLEIAPDLDIPVLGPAQAFLGKVASQQLKPLR
ncbi:2-amino-4-hydroxy-6-hydroxymethyldihydropteridine diphosphokinase [Amantichitinum ursilacus]|uniref:2-amino-4-hydroxy-6-hydroxymethyldihydropteridine pyrophosphokinase n=1 Tax=Amantichitinum ursilacus TaxID=857265 RepID=A0A0N0GP16_9NEIS|nr:2-amino-4-hydroxy-6-hydroxymethyldihydropteridine diphosphokinase [Amantichitinum ursilacus]KPC53276.1 2-amino-4-hydroxy-6-hydroxymethyldihydropteridine pyrophosphokinase [Amantichitinum ursilacus]